MCHKFVKSFVGILEGLWRKNACGILTEFMRQYLEVGFRAVLGSHETDRPERNAGKPIKLYITYL